MDHIQIVIRDIKLGHSESGQALGEGNEENECCSLLCGYFPLLLHPLGLLAGGLPS